MFVFHRLSNFYADNANTSNGVKEAILRRPMHTGQEKQNANMDDDATTSKCVEE